MKTLFALLTATLLVGISGCAWMNEMDSTSTEQLLVASGFQTRMIDTPKKQAMVAELTPYRVQMRSKGNKVYYVYPDTRKGIVLVGGPLQYQQFQKLSVQQEVAEDQMTAAAEMQMMNMDEMGMWDPFW